MDILGRKDPSLRDLVGELARKLPVGSFVLVDHWDADPFAIGLARPLEHDHLVYIHADRDVHGRYFMSRELPARNDLDVYLDAGSDQFQEVDQLARAIAQHLGST